ncbi:MAG: CoB--CoM heterodisulfide reductase iron-sulfur subunit B family protein [Deltaproteobacteria bacterium]|nr:CoB--CoM heterodisulfide reductase iron-sulfur subunit B family protein [Deltaproteobacteria bacterium]
MEFALQRCCTTPIFLKQYESSTNAVLEKLGVGLVDIKEFNCCGYPLRNFNFKAYVLSSAGNLALAEKENLNIMTFCNCCYGTLKHANHIMGGDSSLKREINTSLSGEGLGYDGGIEVKHLLEVLYKDIGIEQIKEKILKRFKKLRIAVHYGCHLLRPRQIIQFDNPENPSIFDELVEITGAESIHWSTKLECCGSPMWGIDDDLSSDLTEKKIMDAIQSGADYLCVACSYCQLQFDRVQKMLLSKGDLKHHLPSILYTQLLGLSMGIDEEVLGINENELDITGIMHYLSQDVSLSEDRI